eukprot:13149021-Alexandrium_andersonii.AAC.1
MNSIIKRIVAISPNVSLPLLSSRLCAKKAMPRTMGHTGHTVSGHTPLMQACLDTHEKAKLALADSPNRFKLLDGTALAPLP